MMMLKVYFRSMKQLVRNPSKLSVIIVFPLILVFIFAFIFSGETGLSSGEITSTTIGYINSDEGDSIFNWRNSFINYTQPFSENMSIDPLTHGFGNLFLQSLEDQTSLKITNVSFKLLPFSTVQEAMNAIRSRAVTLSLLIPYDFSLGVLSGLNSRELLVNGSYIENNSAILNKNTSITLLGDPSYLMFQNTRTAIEAALNYYKSAFYGLNLPAGHYNIEMESIATVELKQFDYFLPGFLTFGLILSSSSIAATIGEEREDRTLDRLKLSKIRSLDYLGGIFLTQITTGGIQLGLMLFAGYLMGFQGPGDPLSAFTIGMITVLPILGLGFFVAAFVPNGRDAGGVIGIISAPLGFLSGAFLEVPSIELLPDLLPAFIPTGAGTYRFLELWDFFPFNGSVSAIRKILLLNYDLNQVIPEIIFLLVGGLIFFAIGTFFFVKRVFKPEN